MSQNSLYMSTYISSTEQEKVKMLHDFAKGINAPPNGEAQDIRSKIMVLEAKYGITSFLLVEEINSGIREENFEICQWLMLIDRLERHR